MAAVIKPLASTLRVLEWDDLPASVRAISDSFNPLADGILMLHQRQVAALRRRSSPFRKADARASPLARC